MAIMAVDVPTRVSISAADIRKQIKLDLFDKEVQSAATYSYLWMADQMGHIGLGLIFSVVAHALVAIFGDTAVWWHWVVAGGLFAAGATFKEIKDFKQFQARENKYFEVGHDLLRWNAVTATVYMFAGLAIGILVAMPIPGLTGSWDLFGGRVTLATSLLLKTGIVAVIIALALNGAWPWLRQKITWQKAALPYLARLPRIPVAFADEAEARALEDYICAAPAVTGETHRAPLLMLGPLGVGKTQLATALGSEAAFLKAKVRYVTFSKLAQSAMTERTLREQGRATGNPELDVADSGPPNINYWPWRTAQLVIVDDIRPGLGPDDYITLDEFKARFQQKEKLGREGLSTLQIRQTVWVVGATAAEERAWIDAFLELFGVAPVVVRVRGPQDVSDPPTR
jgi:hypothetical protein